MILGFPIIGNHMKPPDMNKSGSGICLVFQADALDAPIDFDKSATPI